MVAVQFADLLSWRQLVLLGLKLHKRKGSIGHMPLERSRVPFENISHKLFKFARSLSQSDTIFVHQAPISHYLVGRGNIYME